MIIRSGNINLAPAGSKRLLILGPAWITPDAQ